MIQILRVGFLRRSLPMAVYNKVARPIFGEEKNLPYPYDLGEFFWMPPVWWRPFWPEMKAFALPSFSEGYIRVNLKGRDPKGIVEPEEYHALCDEIEALVRGIVNPRTGNPIVRDVMRTREEPLDDNPKLPKADMVFLWTNEVADVVDSEIIGRIGPVPLERSGGHTDRGFMIATGPDILAGLRLPEAHCLDLTATLVDAIGTPVPEYMEGKSFLDQMRAKPAEAAPVEKSAAPTD